MYMRILLSLMIKYYLSRVTDCGRNEDNPARCGCLNKCMSEHAGPVVDIRIFSLVSISLRAAGIHGAEAENVWLICFDSAALRFMLCILDGVCVCVCVYTAFICVCDEISTWQWERAAVTLHLSPCGRPKTRRPLERRGEEGEKTALKLWSKRAWYPTRCIHSRNAHHSGSWSELQGEELLAKLFKQVGETLASSLAARAPLFNDFRKLHLSSGDRSC